jgi:transglutaminase-like putative cysteine protease
MPSDERPTRRGADLSLTIGVLVAVFAALLPLMRVVRPSSWLLGAIALSVAVLAAGFIARRYRLPALAVSLIEASVWVVFMMLVFLRDTALLWIIPTPETIRALPGLLNLAGEEIALGAAPLDASLALSLLIVGGTGLLTIVVDHVVLTARMPLLAAIGLIAVSLIPSIAVPGEVDVMAFVLLAVAILFLMRTDTRSREEPTDREATRTAGVPATALGIGAIAVVVALVAVPLLPQPVARAGSGTIGTGPGIDATLQLGDDLRRPSEIQVMVVRSDAPSAPYLRATTLSQLEGSVWEPDKVRTVPLENELALGTVVVDPDIRVVEYTTSVEVTSLASPWLPVAYPAVAVNGLSGRWAAAPYNRTVLSEAASTQGQNYEVVTNVPRPTLEQIRSHPAGGPDQRDGTTALPGEISPIVGDLAAEVTAGTTNDYDALIALQAWFRGPDFRYSLDAPVEDGFDGSGTDAVAKFLEVREGYCIHYASAFALMARTLGMPSRIVVGYLPGSATTDAIDRQTIYSVSSGQLHAWPEVLFEGIGWVPFEPTNGLGVPTSFTAAGSAPGLVDDPAAATPAPRQHGQPAARADDRARHPVRAGDPGAAPRAAPPADAHLGPQRRRGGGVARRAGRCDRPRHRRPGERDAPRTRHTSRRAARRARRRDEPADQRDRARKLCAWGQARVLAGRCDRGCRHHGTKRAAGVRRHASPAAGDLRAAIADRPAGQRVCGFRSDRASTIALARSVGGFGR